MDEEAAKEESENILGVQIAYVKPTLKCKSITSVYTKTNYPFAPSTLLSLFTTIYYVW